MWPKATVNVLEEFYCGWEARGGGGGGMCPHFFDCGGVGGWYVCAPHF